MAPAGGECVPASGHIAQIDFPAFYAGAFPSAGDSAQFFQDVEALPGDRRGRAKTVLHQAARMLWLADRMEAVARGRPALQILFFLIAAEAVAKLAFNFVGEGQSRHYVQKFFKSICGDVHRDRMSRAFSFTGPKTFLSSETAVDFLYDVRCEVVHTGLYFTTSLLHSPDSTPMLTPWEKGGQAVHLIAHISASELRQIILEGAVMGAKHVIDD
jgi:hypothetical protein